MKTCNIFEVTIFICQFFTIIYSYDSKCKGFLVETVHKLQNLQDFFLR